jgi:predicted nucleotidyltransferase
VVYLNVKLVKLVKNHFPDVKVVYLFGSSASGQAHADSDIDIAILPTTKLSPISRWEIQQLMAEQLDRDVDLVDLLSASTVMQKEIISKGICLYSINSELEKFEMQVMSMYQHLNVERADLLTEFIGKEQ